MLFLWLQFLELYTCDVCPCVYIYHTSKKKILKFEAKKCLAFSISEEYRVGLQNLYMSSFLILLNQLTRQDNQTNGINKSSSAEGTKL